MMKILHGLRYDTEKSDRIGHGGLLDGPMMQQWTAELYRTPRAKHYFLFGEGGPLSRFGQAAGNNVFEYGSDIIPLTEAQALEFASAYLPDTVI